MPLRVTVIIPVFNEAPTLGELIGRVRATNLASEIIAVDDGSSDGSAAVLELLIAEPGISLRLARHEKNRGKGAAIRTGLELATGQVVLIQDADLEYNPADYPALLAPFADPAVQVVYGSRNLQLNPQSSFNFYWGGRFLSWLANRLFDAHLTDEATGYKVVRTPLLRELDLRADGFEFCPELTALLLKRGERIIEVPISYQPRQWTEGKKIRWYHGLGAIWTLVKLRLG